MTAERTLAEVADPTPLRDRMVDAMRGVVRAELSRTWAPATHEERGRFDGMVDLILAPWAESLPGTQRTPTGERAVATRVQIPVADRESASEMLRMVLAESRGQAVVARRQSAAVLGVPYATLSSWYRGPEGNNGRTLGLDVLSRLLGKLGWDLELVATKRGRRP